MKKILNISVIAMLTILPVMAANAAAVAGDPGATTADAPVAQYAPKYGLKESAETDKNLATAGYVKGAYNATIKAINKLEDKKQDKLSDDQITAINNAINLVTNINNLTTTVGDANSGLVKRVTDLETNASGYATTGGAAATAAAAVNGATIDLSGIQAQTGTVGGTATAQITVMDTWGVDTPSDTKLSANVDLSKTEVVTGITGNTAGQKGKISAGTVSYAAN